jgi:mRNA-degrading endonuclease RelE of RelBE toxin-antitoxin system
MSGFTLFGLTILKSQAEKEIQKLFERYERTLSDQKQKMCDDITEWGDALMNSIYKHVNQQKYRLEKEYENQIRNLNKACQQFIEKLHVHEQSDNTEQITQLLDQCKALKFELATLKYNEQTVPFVKVPSKQPLVMNRDGSDVIETEYDQSNNSSTVKYDNETEEDNMNTDSILYRNMAFTNTKQTE